MPPTFGAALLASCRALPVRLTGATVPVSRAADVGGPTAAPAPVCRAGAQPGRAGRCPARPGQALATSAGGRSRRPDRGGRSDLGRCRLGPVRLRPGRPPDRVDRIGDVHPARDAAGRPGHGAADAPAAADRPAARSQHGSTHHDSTHRDSSHRPAPVAGRAQPAIQPATRADLLMVVARPRRPTRPGLCRRRCVAADRGLRGRLRSAGHGQRAAAVLTGRRARERPRPAGPYDRRGGPHALVRHGAGVRRAGPLLAGRAGRTHPAHAAGAWA